MHTCIHTHKNHSIRPYYSTAQRLSLRHAYTCTCTVTYTFRYICIHAYKHAGITLIERNTPPGGVFFVGWFPHQEPRGRGQSLNNNPQNSSTLGIVLQGGPLSSGFLILKPPNKETPPHPTKNRGVFLSINLIVEIHTNNIHVTYVLTDI